jgi:glycosyltransferase involved in cell wall biosynthesis
MAIKQETYFYFLFFSFILFTSYLSNIFKTSSFQFFTTFFIFLISIFIILMINKNEKLKQKYSLRLEPFLISLFVYIFAISIISFINHSNFDFLRFIISYILIIIYMISSFYVAVTIYNIDDTKIYNYVKVLYFILLLDGIISSINYHFTTSKVMVLFAEPSHFALILLPITLFIYIKKDNNFLILIPPLIISLAIQNLTLLVGIFLFFICQKRNNFLLKIVILGTIVILLINFYDFSYFIKRLDFSSVKNMSTLVFLSGWENAILNFKDTHGLGIGFNQLGLIGEQGYYRSILVNDNHGTVNLYDGGTTGSKLISEIGIVGVFLLLIYLYSLFKFYKIILNKIILNNKDILIFSFFFSAFFEFFLRGIGYFTLGMFLFLVSCIYLKKYNILNKYNTTLEKNNTTDKKLIIISAINLRTGGTLTILNDCLNFVDEYLYKNYRILVLVHRKDVIIKTKNLDFIEFPNSVKSYFFRFYYEYIYFKYLSKRKKPYLWFSLHDMTPNVEANIRAVYCHNPTPFYKISFKEFLFDKKSFLFYLFYKYIYRINIHKNDYVVVQQNWLKEEFLKMYKIKNCIVSYPSIPIRNVNEIDLNLEKNSKLTLFYPSFPRVFKNIELICEVMEKLIKYKDIELILTINGSENKYSKYLYKKYCKNKNIKFIGLQTRKRIFELYEVSDCLIFPSKLETWGLPLSEYKIFNKPILVSNLEYAKETIGNYKKVKFFNPNNVEELAKIIIDLYLKKLKYDEVKNKKLKSDIFLGWDQLFKKLLIKERANENN